MRFISAAAASVAFASVGSAISLASSADASTSTEESTSSTKSIDYDSIVYTVPRPTASATPSKVEAQETDRFLEFVPQFTRVNLVVTAYEMDGDLITSYTKATVVPQSYFPSNTDSPALANAESSSTVTETAVTEPGSSVTQAPSSSASATTSEEPDWAYLSCLESVKTMTPIPWCGNHCLPSRKKRTSKSFSFPLRTLECGQGFEPHRARPTLLAELEKLADLKDLPILETYPHPEELQPRDAAPAPAPKPAPVAEAEAEAEAAVEFAGNFKGSSSSMNKVSSGGKSKGSSSGKDKVNKQVITGLSKFWKNKHGGKDHHRTAEEIQEEKDYPNGYGAVSPDPNRIYSSAGAQAVALSGVGVGVAAVVFAAMLA